MVSVILDYLLWAEKPGDRHRCPRAVEVVWMSDISAAWDSGACHPVFQY
jgi:hypothetical protein